MNIAAQLVKIEDHSLSRQRETARPISVLIVDDHSDDFVSIERFLRMPIHQQYNAVHCDNFEQAFIEMHSGEYDIALLDYHIDGRHGTDLIEAFDRNPPVPVILFAGSKMAEFGKMEKEALDAGAFDILNKHDLSCAALTRSIGFAIKRFETESEIRNREAELRKAHEQAEAAHFSKSEFLAHLSHELRTPLNAILGFSQVLKDDTMNLGMDEKYKDYADTVHQSGLHLLDMFNDLLELTETDSDAYDERMERFKRYRTWILDREEVRRAVRKDTDGASG